jgi:spermidine synthase
MRRALPFIYGLFTLSGFVGLIYESLLSRYMKLFLGHSSYGQIFTLVTFMGGLGLGAFLAARHSQRFRNPFLVYGVIEIVIALFALAFHQLYLWTTDGYFMIAGDLSAVPYAPLVVRVLFCLLLTLPLSTLLGMTFPIAAAGVMRLTGDEGKSSLSILYFTNSIGAAAGILCTSYFFLKQFGTTGTLQLASLGNLTVAFGFLAVGLLVGVTGLAQRPATASFTSEAHSEWWGVNRGEIRLWLFVALGTGLASFIYEVGWIRLLSLMMGSSTHSFDIMVSAFIFGLAFGGLYALHLMNRANADIPRTMAYVQIAMGLLALSSLFTYRLFFNAVDASHSILMRNEDAYLTYSVFKYLLALGLMLPASFCAGMTLPMITHHLVQKTGSEQFTGYVYAWNTFGDIFGAMAGGIFLLPALQLEGTILAGALLDAAIGLVILYFLPRRLPVELIATAVVVIVAIPAFNQQFDLGRITAGQFRAFNTSAPPVTALQHGRTATISVHKRSDGLLSLITNGKSDGAIQSAPAVNVCSVGDESTVAQLALLPMMTRGDRYNAAMIGLGTGMTLHYLLGDSLLDAVDLIEIEEAVPKLAESFRPRNERAYTDPRVNLIIDDAKSYFYSNRKQYDLIITEPSNPWVSGVSSLFTKEFYRHTQQILKPGGMLVQWIHSYEFSYHLMLSVLCALNEFAYFEIYSIPNSADLMILASDFPISFAGLPRLRTMTTTQAVFQMLGCTL